MKRTAVTAAIVLMTSALLPDRASAGFSEAQSEGVLRQDVQAYVRRVLGAKEPTLEDLYHFDAGAAELENRLEERECRRRLEPSHCQEWIMTRALSQASSPSLYLREVRRLVRVRPGSVVLRKVGPRVERGDFAVIADAATPDGRRIRLVFGHARSEASPVDSSAGSLVWLEQIEATSVRAEIEKLAADAK